MTNNRVRTFAFAVIARASFARSNLIKINSFRDCFAKNARNDSVEPNAKVLRVFLNVVFIVAGSFLLASCRLIPAGDRVCFEKQCVDVEVVSTPDAMQKGLQGRTSLPKNAGMFFMFQKPDHQLFWMKDTLIPLDLIWMDQQRRVVHIRHDARPCKAEPCETFGSVSREAIYVLEVNAGYCARHGLKKGDQAEFRLKK